jgi:hypothetical protein
MNPGIITFLLFVSFLVSNQKLVLAKQEKQGLFKIHILDSGTGGFWNVPEPSRAHRKSAVSGVIGVT